VLGHGSDRWSASKTIEMDEPREGGQLAAGVLLLGMDQTLVLSETLG
jgi:hypothetical protein